MRVSIPIQPEFFTNILQIARSCASREHFMDVFWPQELLSLSLPEKRSSSDPKYIASRELRIAGAGTRPSYCSSVHWPNQQVNRGCPACSLIVAHPTRSVGRPLRALTSVVYLPIGRHDMPRFRPGGHQYAYKAFIPKHEATCSSKAGRRRKSMARPSPTYESRPSWRVDQRNSRGHLQVSG